VPRSRKVLADVFVEGRPYVPGAARGSGETTDQWTSWVIDHLLRIPRPTGACELEVEFVLPANRDPWELPWEMSLDHLLARLLDALGRTALRRDPSDTASFVEIRASRRNAGKGEVTGARVVILRAESKEAKGG
jgi:hypothetical protein